MTAVVPEWCTTADLKRPTFKTPGQEMTDNADQ